jgi:hypothetical protein
MLLRVSSTSKLRNIGNERKNVYESIGVLHYGSTSRLSLDVDYELVRYYRTFIPPSVSYNIPMHPPHVTVVRTGMEKPVVRAKWGAYEGERVRFQYNPYIHFGRLYIWLRVECKRLEEIRLELGLNRCRDRYKWFHITIGNLKGCVNGFGLARLSESESYGG